MLSASPEYDTELHFNHGAEMTHAHALLGFLALMEDERFDPTEPSNFRTVVGQAVSRYDISAGAIARQFEFHASTPSRWLNNKSLPQPVVRKLVVGWIKEQIEEKIAALMPSPEELDQVNRRAHEQLDREMAG